LFIGIFLLNPSIGQAQAQGVFSEKMPQVPKSFGDYEVIEATVLIRNTDGDLYRISKVYSPSGELSYFQNGGTSFSVTPVIWGEDYMKSALDKVSNSWNEIKTYMNEILTKMAKMLGLIGMIVIFVGTGILTFLVNTTFPVFPPRFLFYPFFVVLCFAWYALTSNVSSIIYAFSILIIPYLVLGLVNLIIRKTRHKLKGSEEAVS